MILVTGATGLVGGNLIWYLLQENERVTAIRRSTSNLEPLRTIFSFYTSFPEDYLSRIDWKIGDVMDIKFLNNTMTEEAIVYHCAAVVSLGNNAEKMVDTNVIGSRNVIRIALENKIKKLCFVSSIAACGSGVTKFIDESDMWLDNPNKSLYSKSKFDSEQEVWKGIKKGLNAVIVNPGVILGVSGTNSGSSQLFMQVQKGLKFYTHGGTGYVNVQDVVKAMIQLTKAEISGERFILVGENCTHKSVLFWMSDGFGIHRPSIPIGKKLLCFVGFISEILGKLFHFHPLIDRRTAYSATNLEYYSSQKIKQKINFQFTSIEKCIQDVCKFQLKK